MKRIILITGAAILFLLFAVRGGRNAEAAVKGIELESGKDIKKYDVTGDGKKDHIRIDCETPDLYNEGSGDGWSISINDKVVFRDNKKQYVDSLTVVLYQIDTKTVYLEIQENEGANNDISSHAFYRYKGNKLKKICDVYQPIAKQIYCFHFYVDSVKVTDKKITVSYVNQFSATGYLFWKISYLHGKDGWKKDGNTYSVTEKRNLTANRKLTLYQTAGGKKKALVLKKGQKVKIDKICLKNGKTYMQAVLSNGKKGWFQSPDKSLPERYYFKEVVFAGKRGGMHAHSPFCIIGITL